jgi:hypothetical protein
MDQTKFTLGKFSFPVFFLQPTVPNRTKTFFHRFFIYDINNNKPGKAKSVGKFLACFSFFKIFDGAWPINTIHTVLIKLLSYI